MTEPTTPPDRPDDQPPAADEPVAPQQERQADPYAERAARDQLLGPGDDPD